VHTTTGRTRLVGLLSATLLIAAACGDDDDATRGDATSAAPAATEAPTATTSGPSETTASMAPGSEAAMTITIELDPDAVWDDGTPITVADFQCTVDAIMNTPGSLSTVGYELITSVEEGSTPQEIVVSLSQIYAPYKNLFSGNPSIIKADAVEDCSDISGDFEQEVPFSARPFKIESWSLDQLILVANENYWGDDAAQVERVIMLPKADADTEINSLLSGEVDFIFPQAFSGITEALEDPNVEFEPGYGTNYEGLYFQQRDGPFADDAFREGFSKSIDRELILATIYDPIFPGSPLLSCGLWVPTIGEWCDNTQFEGSFDLAAAEEALTAGGWAKNGDGLWEKDGVVPEIRWMVNTPNPRRENTQALMIPELREHGFNVVPSNGDAAQVFQQRIPALDYDLAMYIQTTQPDPTVTSIMSCDQIPGPENDNQGQNNTGWCNEEATALMHESDQTVDEAERVDQIHRIGQYLVDDSVMLPLYQFPNIAAYRSDRLGGPVTADAGNYRAFANNLSSWEDVDGDGQILIGAEQWPECMNPITECSNSSWYFWSAGFNVLPSVWDTTADGSYVPTSLVTGEPTVATAES
jgi:peptide/nickel transport system substrate-binding protein